MSLDLVPIRTTLDGLRAGMDRFTNPRLTAAMWAADQLLAEVERLRAENEALSQFRQPCRLCDDTGCIECVPAVFA